MFITNGTMPIVALHPPTKIIRNACVLLLAMISISNFNFSGGESQKSRNGDHMCINRIPSKIQMIICNGMTQTEHSPTGIYVFPMILSHPIVLKNLMWKEPDCLLYYVICI